MCAIRGFCLKGMVHWLWKDEDSSGHRDRQAKTLAQPSTVAEAQSQCTRTHARTAMFKEVDETLEAFGC